MGLRAEAGLALAVLCVPLLAAAEERVTLADLSPGDRVRARLASGHETIFGVIDAAGPNEVVVRTKDKAQAPLHLSLAQVARLEVARGRRSHWVAGAAIGFLPGAFLGVAAAANAECDPDCDHTGEAIAFGCLGGIVTGAAGALVGLAVRTDRWAIVEERRPKVALALGPARGGLRASVSLRF
jgi:hypothetical protein